MKSGFVLYAASVECLAGFYRDVFGLSLKESDAGYARLVREDFEMVLLETATSTRGVSASGTALVVREETPVKPVFFVDEVLDSVRERVLRGGGGMRPPKDWMFGGRVVCDGWDVEGNVFQVRVLRG